MQFIIKQDISSETGKIIIEDKKIIIKPEDFIISDQSIAVHCIDNDATNEHGSDIKEVLRKLENDLKSINIIYLRNLEFVMRQLLNVLDIRFILNLIILF